MLAFSLLTLAVGAWLGAVVFQSALVAPVVFSTLDAGGARDVLRTLFPRFFLLGVGCLATALVAALLLPAASGRALPIGILATALAMIVAARLLVPAINRARDAGDAGRKRFGRLHGLSVLLTLASLLGALAAVTLACSAVAAGTGIA